MIVIICALLAMGAIGFTLLVRARDIPPPPVEIPELKHLETRRQVLYENLKDLQFEYLQGKLSDADYQSVKGGFLNDLAGVMASIEPLQRDKERAEKKAADDHRDPFDKLPSTPLRAGTEARRKSHLKKEIAGKETAAEEPVAQQKPTSGDHHGSLICSACGAENPGQHRYCGQCGAALSE